MYKLTRLVTFADATHGDAVAEGLRALAVGHGAYRALVAPTLPGSHNGGDLIAHVQFDTEPARDAFEAATARLLAGPATASVESVAYIGAPDLDLMNGVYRVLLLSVDKGADPAAVARFEAETRMMPHYIAAIRNWQLSRTDAASGSRAWTHVWEQEYADAAGLLGPYMLHPYHWAHVDRWFDPECPDRIVDARLCHSFCTIDALA
ncbi:Dabb family protein [Sphingomonas cavernae]|uniref:Dabb family protein n=1 Tax=Sphingomonas cavernae TaxID=2320861 RepID=A0A418WPI2_9SPHN|nr:Dabb family protein [Sphingomonas cavernae]RJF93133.1 Dabb family protein [Sphingomonas cavernae]